MRRRTFLTSSGVVLGMSLAGCNSLTGSDGKQNNSSNGSQGNGDESTPTPTPTPELTTVGGNASFARLQIGGPSNVTVGDEFNLPISVANVGGKNGTFSGRLVITEGRTNLNRTVTIEDVGSGEKGQALVKSLNFTYADTYTFAIEGTDVTKTVTVEPITKQLGQSFTLVNGLSVTVQDVAFQPSVFYTTSGWESEQTWLQSAPSSHILGIIRLSLENTGAQAVEFGTDTLSVPNGALYTQLEDGISLSAAQIKGQSLSYTTLAPAETKNGWLLAQLPRSVAKKTFSIVHQRDSSGTPPEVQWTVPPKSGSTRSLPQFSLKSFKTPKTVEINSKKPMSIVVSNDGKAAGRFRGVIWYRVSESNEWYSGWTLSGDIKAGGTKEFTPKLQNSSTKIIDLRLQPFDKTRSVEYVPATMPFGKSYMTPSGIKITVSDIHQSNKYVVKDDYDGEPTKATENNHFIFAKVKTEVVEQDVYGFGPDSFTFVHKSEEYETKHIDLIELASPVMGSPFEYSTYKQGAVTTGWIVFSVPEEYTANEAVIRWTGSDGAIAEWRHKPNKSGSSSATSSSSSTSKSK